MRWSTEYPESDLRQFPLRANTEVIRPKPFQDIKKTITSLNHYIK